MPKGPNAFLLFVYDRKRDLEKEGKKFTGIQEAIELIGPEWQHLPKPEREMYDKRAKEKKQSAKAGGDIRRVKAAGEGWNKGEEKEKSNEELLRGIPG